MTTPRLNPAGFLILIALALVLGGCAAADHAKAPPGPLRDPLPPQAYPEIVPTGGLARWLYFDNPIVTPGTDDRPMQVSVPVRMVYNEPREIQYCFQFFGADGRPLDSRKEWHWKHVEPRIRFFLEGNALQPEAVEWNLEIRPAR